MNLIEFAKSLKKDGRFISATFRSDMSTMRKGTKNAPNPFYGRVHKVLNVQTKTLDYEGSLRRQGEDRDTQPIWCGKGHHVSPFVVEHDNGNLYFQISNEYLQMNSSEMFVDGKPATEEELCSIKSWISPKEDTNIFYVKMGNLIRLSANGKVVENENK